MKTQNNEFFVLSLDSKQEELVDYVSLNVNRDAFEIELKDILKSFNRQLKTYRKIIFDFKDPNIDHFLFNMLFSLQKKVDIECKELENVNAIRILNLIHEGNEILQTLETLISYFKIEEDKFMCYLYLVEYMSNWCQLNINHINLICSKLQTNNN